MQGTGFYKTHKETSTRTGDVPWFDTMDAVHAGPWTVWIRLSTTGPSQFLRKNAMSVPERNVSELPSRSHAVLGVNAARTCSSPASQTRNACKSNGKAGRPATVAHPLHDDGVRRANSVCYKGSCRDRVAASRVGRYLGNERRERHPVSSWPARSCRGSGKKCERRTNIVDTSGARRSWPWPLLRWSV